MNKNIYPRVLMIIGVIFLSACQVDVDEDELDELATQLENVYSSCENEDINDVDDLENTLNAGGNNLSKACRNALAKVDFAALVDAFDIKLEFELPDPDKEINPLRTEASSWHIMSDWASINSTIYLSTGLDNVEQSDIILRGKTASGIESNINNFLLTDVFSNQLSLHYTTDYSASMLESDIVAVSGYYKQFHNTLSNSTLAKVAIFSDEVTDKTTGFTSDSGVINTAFDFDPSYERAGTALYDAWSTSIDSLETVNRAIMINLVTTDGFENSSSMTKSQLQSKVSSSDVFNVVIASSWAETSKLKEIVGEKGFVVYNYQIDQATNIVNDINSLLSHVKMIQITDDVSGFEEISLIYAGKDKLKITLP